MAKLSLLLVLVSALVAGVVVGAAPVYAADCTHPPDTISVNIDVKPGSFPNPTNLRSAGVLPVAVLGSSDFSVAEVDLGTVGLHPMGRCEQDVAATRHAFEDVNQDGYMDIVFHSATKAVGFRLGDAVACLHGILAGGVHFCGHDSIVVLEH